MAVALSQGGHYQLSSIFPREPLWQGWAALSYLLSPLWYTGRAGASHSGQTLQTLLRKSFHKFEVDFPGLIFISVYVCDRAQERVHAERAQRPGECWSLGASMGALFCRCCNPNSNPYDWTAGTLNQWSHLSRTEILLWCLKYNHICKFISIFVLNFEGQEKGFFAHTVRSHYRPDTSLVLWEPTSNQVTPLPSGAAHSIRSRNIRQALQFPKLTIWHRKKV